MDAEPKYDSAALSAAIASIFCYGATPVFLRYFIDYLDFWTVNGVRYTAGALFWLPFVILLSRRAAKSAGDGPRRNVWRDAMIPAGINLVCQVGWAITPYYLEAGVIGFVYKTHFLFTIVLGFILIPAERPIVRNRWFQAGTLVCVGGVLAMFLRDLQGGERASLVGVAILTGATAMFGAYAVAVRRCMVGYPARLSFGVISLYTAAGLVALMFAFGDYGRLATLEPRLWVFVVLSAITGIAFAHVLYYRAIHGLGAIVSTGLLMATPFVTFLGATVILGERMNGMQFVGGLFVVLGGVMLVIAQKRAGPSAEEREEGRISDLRSQISEQE